MEAADGTVGWWVRVALAPQHARIQEQTKTPGDQQQKPASGIQMISRTFSPVHGAQTIDVHRTEGRDRDQAFVRTCLRQDAERSPIEKEFWLHR
ncbi:MAG: hypothetical protein ACO3S0_08140 [bacterium]